MGMADTAVMMATDEDDWLPQATVDHRLLPRTPRKQYDHARAYQCIQSDYLAPVPTFDFKEFEDIYRISRPRYQRLREDVMNLGHSFYSGSTDALDRQVSCLDARLLMPLKCLAYGVPAQAFRDYFQMSKTFARDCRNNFDEVVAHLYQEEYLGLPTANDLRNISNLHSAAHGVTGMLGSLDCMHNRWKNCPVQWQGAYQGAKKVPTIVLEAMCDYNLYFWHASFGYAGTLNDITIFDMSPLLENMVSGKLTDLETAGGVVPFDIGEEEFPQMFILVDGIYPQYSRFVKTLSDAVLDWETQYSAWQEAARKDIERAFGVFQNKFQYMARPFIDLELRKIGNRVNTCLILHNMCVVDRVMGDVRARYDPSAADIVREITVDVPADRQAVQRVLEDPPEIGWQEQPRTVLDAVVRRRQWHTLMDITEHERLHVALVELKTGHKL